jgi:cytochrome b
MACHGALIDLLTNDDIAFEGPLARHVSGAVSSALTTWHRRNEWVLLALIGLHVAALVYWRLARGRELVRPMLGGDAWDGADTPPSRDDASIRLRALAIAAACGAAVAWLVRG